MKIFIASDVQSFRDAALKLLLNQPIESTDLEGLVLLKDEGLLTFLNKLISEHLSGIRNNAPVSTNENFLELLRTLHSVVLPHKEYLPGAERKLREDINTFWTPMH